MGNCVCMDRNVVVGEEFSPRSDPLKPLLELQQALKEEEVVEEKRVEEGAGKGVVRVRVLLTKAEAARLLENSAGAVLEQLVCELEKMGSQKLLLRDGRLPSFGGGGPWRPALESIPEVACVE